MWAHARRSSDAWQMMVWIIYQLLCIELKEANEAVRDATFGRMHRLWQSLWLLSNVDPFHFERDACAICCEPLPRCAVVLNCGHSLDVLAVVASTEAYLSTVSSNRSQCLTSTFTVFSTPKTTSLSARLGFNSLGKRRPCPTSRQDASELEMSLLAALRSFRRCGTSSTPRTAA